MALTNADRNFIEMSLSPIVVNMNNIDDHLKKLNSKVSTHEQIINKGLREKALIIKEVENLNELPERIKHLEEYRVNDEAAHRTIRNIIIISSTLVAMAVAVIEIFLK